MTKEAAAKLESMVAHDEGAVLPGSLGSEAEVRYRSRYCIMVALPCSVPPLDSTPRVGLRPVPLSGHHTHLCVPATEPCMVAACKTPSV